MKFRPNLERLGCRAVPSAVVPDGPRELDPVTGLPVVRGPEVVAPSPVVLLSISAVVAGATVANNDTRNP